MSGQPDLTEAAQVYRVLMDEARVRLDAIDRIVGKLRAAPDAPDAFIDAETAFLQLRMVCDLVALSILAAHQPFGLDDDLLQSWQSRVTLARLHDINPEGFPKPVRLDRLPSGLQFQMLPNHGLTSRRLQRFYDRSGKHLHRGVLAHLLAGRVRQYDIGSVARWSAMIRAVLGHHVLMIPEKGMVLIVHLTGGPDGSAQVAIAEAPGPFVIVQDEGDPTADA